MTKQDALSDHDRRLRIGVLGAGPIAQFAHFEACRKACNAELYAICDVAPDLLAQVAAEHAPATTYGDYDEMLADPQVDAVIVAIADQFHVSAARGRSRPASTCWSRSRSASTSTSARRSRARCTRAASCCRSAQCGASTRGSRSRATSSRDELGELIALKAWYCDSAYRYTMTDALQPIARSSDRARRPDGDPKSDRRRYLMLGHGSHLVDTARYLAGDVASVNATLRRARRRPLLVRPGRAGERRRRPARPDDERADGLARGLPGLRRARQRDRQDVPALVPAHERGRVLLRARPPLPPPARRGLRTSSADRSRASRTRSSTARRCAAPPSTTGWRPCA